jgi:hypothetical protein
MMKIRPLLLILTLFGSFACGFTAVGCSTMPMMTQEERQANRERESIERPARPLSEEESFFDDVGKVAVVLLIVGITVAGVLVPLLLI